MKILYLRKIPVIEIVDISYQLCIVLPYTYLNSARKEENLAKKRENFMFFYQQRQSILIQSDWIQVWVSCENMRTLKLIWTSRQCLNMSFWRNEHACRVLKECIDDKYRIEFWWWYISLVFGVMNWGRGRKMPCQVTIFPLVG